MTPRPPAGPPARRFRGAAYGLVEVFVRDALVNITGTLSLVVVLAGVLHRESAWGLAVVGIGVVGLPLPWLSLTRQRPTRILRMVVRGVLLLDLALLAAVLYAI